MSSSANDGSTSPFTGYWKLDRERSDPPTVHLESIGLSELAREAAEKMEILMHLVHHISKGTLLIIQDSILGEKERLLTVGQEHQEQARDGSSIRMKLEYATAHVQTSSSTATTIPGSTIYSSHHHPNLRTLVEWGTNIRITETKAIADNGNELHQEIIMMLKGNKVTRTRRIFIRTTQPVVVSSPLPEDG